MIKKTYCDQCNIEFYFDTRRNKPTRRFCSHKCHGFSQIKQYDIQYMINVYNKKCIKQDGCWSWDGNHDTDGYGIMYFNKKLLKAHRVSWNIHNGEIPGKLFVLHKCDNPPCTNPDHLFLGDVKDNWNDMFKKGRGGHEGELANNAKLKKEETLEIKRLLNSGIKQSYLAKKFNVNRQTIHRIKHEKSWKNLNE